MKSFLKMVLPVVLLIALFFAAQQLNQPKVEEGQKTITIRYFVEEDGERVDLGSSETISNDETDIQTLGDLIDRINESDVGYEFELGGSKQDTYGRFIVGINEYITQDMSSGPWWMYDSTTNKDCIEAGFCSGMDVLPVYDNDIFEFTFGYGD